MRVVWGIFTEEVGAEWEGAIDFIGGDVVEAAGGTFRCPIGVGLDVVILLPAEAGSLKEGEGAEDVGAGKGERILDRAVNVGFGCKVYDAIHLLLLHQLIYGLEITDIHTDESVVGSVFDVTQIGKIAGVGELIYIDDAVVGVFVDKESDYVAAYEAGSAGDEDGSFHFRSDNRYCPYWFFSIGLASSRTRSGLIHPFL